MPLARQALHDSGEDIHIAAWPTVKDMLQIASRHYAFEGRCYVLAAGSLMRASALPPELEAHPAIVNSPDQFILRGGSAIIGPDGRYVCEPIFESPALLVADLDLGFLAHSSDPLFLDWRQAGQKCCQVPAWRSICQRAILATRTASSRALRGSLFIAESSEAGQLSQEIFAVPATVSDFSMSRSSSRGLAAHGRARAVPAAQRRASASPS
jgi:hypothetical protein